MFNEDVKRSVEKSVLCWLASVDEDGQPNVSPKECFALLGETELLIAEIASPVSRRNIARNPRVCVSFIDVFAQAGYKVIGDARFIERNDPDFAARHALLSRYEGTDFFIRGIISVNAHRVGRILAPSYKVYPDRTEAEHIRRTHATYGVRAVE